MPIHASDISGSSEPDMKRNERLVQGRLSVITEDYHSGRSGVSWWQVVLFSSLAGGLGWGIRGQYGHETGAMTYGQKPPPPEPVSR
jgi:hypothetical protein